MLNRDVFARNPLDFTLPNDGVAKVGEPVSDNEWDVLRFELESFVCEGEYQKGLQRILQSFLRNLDKSTQPAVWVSGFYGSGKSHLVRVLQYLWKDQQLPGGASARGLIHLPDDISELLKELSVRGKQAGGLWSAAGKLGGGAGDSIRLSVLRILFQAAGLPTNYVQARFVLWLKGEGLYDSVNNLLVLHNRNLEKELPHLYVSTHLANALLQAKPDFAEKAADALQLFKTQFIQADEISEEEFLNAVDNVLRLQSTNPQRLPLTLVVLDELEQYVADNTEKMLKLQEVVESCSIKFEGQLLFVATGQSALQATAQLSKMKDRFTVRVELSSADVETVIRQVALRKQPNMQAQLDAALEKVKGEIDRQLTETKIAPNPADRQVLSADYPLLPSRRRFWERVLRAVDRAGTAGQLRTQLRIVLEAARDVALQPLGTAVGGDYIYSQLRDDMVKSGLLSPDIESMIEDQRKLPDGELKARLAGLIFLMGKLPTEGAEDMGLRSTAQVLTDLMVRDLSGEGPSLRQRIPVLLLEMADSGTIMQVGGEYRLQSKASSEWEADYRSRLRGIENDVARIASKRQEELKSSFSKKVGSLKISHGQSKTPRTVDISFNTEKPVEDGGKIPVWVRNGWELSEKDARNEAREMGLDSPIVSVYIPRERDDELKRKLAQYLATQDVLSSRATPADRDGLEAKAAMESRFRLLKTDVDVLIEGIVGSALVLQGGGTEIVDGDLKARVQHAAESAVERLFPEFKIADDKKWENVVKRAREGNASALAELGFQDDAEKHPVTKKILAFLNSPKEGSAVRRHFMAAPYGWSQDVVDGSLLVLVASGLLRAELQGSTKTARQIEQSSLGRVQFRSEATVINVQQKMALRKLLTDCGVGFNNDEEAAACLKLIEKIQAAAHQAGGHPPMPESPNPPYLPHLATLRGNDLLLEVFNHKDRLLEDLKQWEETHKAIQERLPRWQTLEKLLSHGANLSALDPLNGQKTALIAHRGLLQTPDPVRHLLEQAAEVLRNKIANLYTQYQQKFDGELNALQENSAWQKLSTAEAQTLLDNHALQPLAGPKLGSPQEVLTALQTLSLGQLEDRVAALHTRFSKALQDAIKRSMPQAVRINLRSANLHTEQDVEEYLELLKQEIMEHIAQGRPVIL